VTGDSLGGFDDGLGGGMALEVDALRRLIAVQLIGAGVRIPDDSLANVSAAILTEAVRISVEWLEAEPAF
jgi:hypothetical protein